MSALVAAAKPTPGPWLPVKTQFARKVFWIVCSRDGRLPETEGNARLQAAAPDLLSAAEHLSALAEQIWVRMSDAEMKAMRDAYAALDAAIAKATTP